MEEFGIKLTSLVRKFLKWGNLKKHVSVYLKTSFQYATNDDNTYDENHKKSLNIMQLYMIPDTAWRL